MMQETETSTSKMFHELPTELCNKNIKNNNEGQENGESSVDMQSIIVDSNNVGAEKYELIYAEYIDDSNGAVNNDDGQLHGFTSEIYTIHLKETVGEICDAEIVYIKEDSSNATATIKDTETLTIQDPVLTADTESGRSKEVNDCENEEPLKLASNSNYNEASPDNTAPDENYTDEVEDVMFLELDEVSAFAAHELDMSLPITCDACCVKFNDMSEFDDHMKGHVETRIFMCQLCSKVYVSWQNLVAHRKACHSSQFICCNDCTCRKMHYNLYPISFPVEDFPVGCEECLQGFNTASELNRHYRCHVHNKLKIEYTEQNKEEKCGRKPEGEESFEKLNAIAKDNSNTSISKISFRSKCNTCQKEMDSFKLYNSHKKVHSDITVQCKCPFCEKVCNDVTTYKTHLSTHISKTQHQCKVCFRKFKSKSSLNAHKYSHPVTEKYRCFNCQMNFGEPHNLVQHIEKIHYQCDDINLICDICTENYPVPKFMEHYLICHARLKSQKAAKRLDRITCKICDKVFSHPNALDRHIKTHFVHSVKLPHLCEICGMVIHQAGAFVLHLRSHGRDLKELHAEQNGTLQEDFMNNKDATDRIKTFMCEFCGKVLKSSSQLKLHVNRHTEGKPCKCSICTMTFYTRAQLSVHMRQHTDERPYECGICKKKFASSGVYHSHRRLHNGTKQHVCPICEKTFLWRSAYHNHVRTHSTIRPYKCDKCPKTFLFNIRLKMHQKVHEKEKVKPLLHQCTDCGQKFVNAIELQNHHEEKCYLSMITFMPSSSVGSKERSPLILLNAKDMSTSFSEGHQQLL